MRISANPSIHTGTRRGSGECDQVIIESFELIPDLTHIGVGFSLLSSFSCLWIGLVCIFLFLSVGCT
jgi:hypothetical protein